MERFTLLSSADGIDLAVCLSRSKQPGTKGVVQLVHGMCEHKERYLPFMEFLSDNGYACIIHDHRGHGESVKSPEDLGYMYNGGWRAMVDDVKLVGDWARNEFPGLKFTLFGHSMGSMVVRSYAKRFDFTIDTLYVCGSPSQNPIGGLGGLIAGAVGFFRGERYRSHLLHNLSLGRNNKAFEAEGSRNAWLTTDKAIQKANAEDPLCQYIFTVNGFRNLISLMKDCYDPEGWVMNNPSLAVHFISGQDDPCRIGDKQHAASVEIFRKKGYRNVDSRIYPGMRHELLNETDRQTVWNDILKQL